MSRSGLLYKIQQFDTELDDSHNRIREIDRIINDKEDIQQAQIVKEEANEILGKKQTILRAAENKVEDHNFKIKQNEKKLYSGTVTNPKELEDLQKESEALAKYLGVLEDRQLDAMLETEVAQESFEKASRSLENLADSKRSQDVALLAERDELEKKINTIEKEKAQFIKVNDIPDLNLYEELRSSHKGIAVSLMVSTSCSACGSNIPSAIAQEARSPSNLAFCPTCKRILHSE